MIGLSGLYLSNKWAGLENGIPEETIQRITEEHGLNPSAVWKFISTYKEAQKIKVGLESSDKLDSPLVSDSEEDIDT